MFHRFTSLTEVAQYVNDNFIKVLVFETAPPAANEDTVLQIISFVQAHDYMESFDMSEFAELFLNGMAPLNGNKWIKELYYDVDHVDPEDKEEYLEEFGSPNQQLYWAILLYYQSKYNPTTESQTKLGLLKDPTE